MTSTEDKKNTFKSMGNFYIECPHCGDIVHITKVNCAIVLHAYNSETCRALNPHSKWYYIDKIKRQGNLVGCGGRFKLKIENGAITSIPISC
jgi:hypothetical protein